MVGLLTLVTNRVGSVTSTSFLVSFGDMRTVSGPMLPVSSGTLPGHSSTTVGLSAPTAGEVTHNHVMRETSATIRFMVAPLESGTQPRHQQHGALPTPTRAYRPRAMAADQRGVLPRTLS